MAKTEIIGYETTPYEVVRVPDQHVPNPKPVKGYAVKQAWWDKIVSPVFKTEAEAKEELVRVCKAAGCYRAIRRARKG